MENKAPEQFLALTKRDGIVAPDEVRPIFDKLQPIEANLLVHGKSWSAGYFRNDPEHPANAIARPIPGLLKLFHSTEDVDPMTYLKDGERVSHDHWGQARLRDMPFHGVLSAAMIYDDHPMIDYFRYVTEDIVACALDAKHWKDLGTLYFYLVRQSSVD